MDATNIGRIMERVAAGAEADAIINELQLAGKEVHHCRFSLLTEMYAPDEVREMMDCARRIIEELKSVIGLCRTELSQPRDEDELR